MHPSLTGVYKTHVDIVNYLHSNASREILLHNLTEELLAEIFNVSRPTISRTINLIEKALLKILEPVIKPLQQALQVPGSLVNDGTLIPTWN